MSPILRVERGYPSGHYSQTPSGYYVRIYFACTVRCKGRCPQTHKPGIPFVPESSGSFLPSFPSQSPHPLCAIQLSRNRRSRLLSLPRSLLCLSLSSFFFLPPSSLANKALSLVSLCLSPSLPFSLSRLLFSCMPRLSHVLFLLLHYS